MNKQRLFTASCLALVTTAFAFAIRAGILNKLAVEFGLTNVQLGFINQSAILGFPIATIVGGYLYNVFGAQRMVWLAFICHVVGIVATIAANNFLLLLLSNFFIGFANGTVEAACNPLIANMYKENQTTMLNRFHVWFPGGIFLGSLISTFLSFQNLGWQVQIAVMLIPCLAYGYLFWGQSFPTAAQSGQAKVSDNLQGMFSPLYLIMIFCMLLTANTELSTQQWVERLLSGAGAQPMLVLALVTGLMAVGRFFAGPVVHRLNPIGVLFASACVSVLGIYLMSQATGATTYLAAVLFAIGVCYFWPTMIGFVGEYIPKSGALGMSIIGGAGMFATGIAQPIVGGWIDAASKKAAAAGLTGSAAELAAGQATLLNLLYFPIILVVIFGAMFFFFRHQLEARRVVHSGH